MKLALGTVQFGLDYGVANQSGRISFGDAKTIIEQSAISGIDTLDTAIAYGASETTLGQVGVEGWQVITKLPALPDDCQGVEAWVAGQIEQSMSRLGVMQLQGVLLHRPDDLLGENGRSLVKALDGLKAEGLTRQVGVSVYAPEQLEELTSIMALDLVQAPLNILDRRLVTSGWASRLKDRGTEVHARSIFLQGLLLMPSGQRPVKFERWSEIWLEWSRWLERTGLTPVQACTSYVLGVIDVDKVIVGVDSLMQLNEILVASQVVLPGLPNWPLSIDSKLINPSFWTQL
jgi:aryl-alcohol dehydrogenase-like predicted oxidoreductase